MPEEGAAFVEALPVAKFHGVGPATAARMHEAGIQTGADLKTWSLQDLQRRFGKAGTWYYAIARARMIGPSIPIGSASRRVRDDLRGGPHRSGPHRGRRSGHGR